MSERTAFVICIEANRLEPQALLLCESIRRFAGPYANAPIIAISPRPELAVSTRTRERLEALDVTYIVEALNTTRSTYGSINRIVAGPWAERNIQADRLVVIDSDTVFLAAPDFDLEAAVGVRPVDAKGSTSEGSHDPQDRYWAHMCDLAGLPLSALPWIETTFDRRTVRASYNGGLAVVRRENQILTKARDIFMASFRRGIRPWGNDNVSVHASTGDVGLEAAQWWGSSQAALSVAIWSSTRDVQMLDSRYNIPVHLVGTPTTPWDLPGAPIFAHYHHLGEAPHRERLLDALDRIGCPSGSLAWLRRGLAIFDEYPPGAT